MYSLLRACFVLAAVLLLVAGPRPAAATQVRMDTLLGVVDVELFDAEAPATVANFLALVNRGDYDGSIIHRSARTGIGAPFVIQGGGFRLDGDVFSDVPDDGTVVNEFGRSNLRGTIAMARVGGIVDSATTQWFFNLGDNSFLDTLDEGFTVFGQVIGDGMDVVDAIAALTRWNGSSIEPAFNEIPLIDFQVGGSVPDAVVVVTSMRVVPEPGTALLLLAGLSSLAWRGRARA